jgi:hypothetical protein
MKKVLNSVLSVFFTFLILITVVACGSSKEAAEKGIPLVAGEVISFGGSIAGGANNGWSEPDNGITWSNGNLAKLTFDHNAEFKNGLNLEISMGSFVSPKNPTMPLIIKANDLEVKNLNFDENISGGDISVNISPEVLAKNSNQLVITFVLPKAVSPESLALSPDKRLLGVWISKIRVSKI